MTLSTKFVTDLLDSARITPPTRRATALPNLVMAQLERLPKSTRVKVEVDIEDTLPPVDVDPVHIGKLLV